MIIYLSGRSYPYSPQLIYHVCNNRNFWCRLYASLSLAQKFLFHIHTCKSNEGEL